MTPSTSLRTILVAMLALVMVACDEIPENPRIPDRLRVALVTSVRSTDQGQEWVLYELDEEGEVEVLRTSAEPMYNGQYTSVLATKGGSVAFTDAEGNLVIRHLESGTEAVLEGDFVDARFSRDAAQVAYIRNDADGRPQLVVLDRASRQVVPVTTNECDAQAPPSPCVLAAESPVFGDDNELYMVRHLRTAAGAEQVAVSGITPALLDDDFLILPLGARRIVPRAFYQGVLLAEYVEHEETAEEVRGYYAIRTRTGDLIDNEVRMSLMSFCHDGTVAGLGIGELRVVSLTSGEEVDRVPVSADYGAVQAVQCSIQSKDV